jgi:uncharacterized membrane protein
MDALSLVKSTTLTRRLDLKFLLYIAIVYFLVTTFLKQLHLFLDYSSPLGLRDLAIFQQPLHNFITGGTLETSLGAHEHQSIFGEHAFLFLVFLIPLYSIFQTPLLLMLSQPLAYISMIFLVYKILKDIYKEDPRIIRLILILLLLNPAYHVTLQNFNIYGFHLEFYFPALFLAAYYFYEKLNIPLFAVFYLLSLSIIEYYSVVWIIFSVYRIFTGKSTKSIDFFVLTFSLAYLACTFLFLIPYFRGTSLPWYAQNLSIPRSGFGSKTVDTVNLAKTLGINLLFNFGIFLFLPLRNMQTLAVFFPVYLAFTVAYLNGYGFPLSAGSWHANAIFPIILLGYVEEFDKLTESRTKINVLKLGFAVAILLAVGVQAMRPAYNQGVWSVIGGYSDLQKDYHAIQSIKSEIRNQPILVSSQLGKYFGDFKDVNVLENGSNIEKDVRYILYYPGAVPLNDQKLGQIQKKYRALKEYKDIVLFEKLNTGENYLTKRKQSATHWNGVAKRFHLWSSSPIS